MRLNFRKSFIIHQQFFRLLIFSLPFQRRKVVDQVNGWIPMFLNNFVNGISFNRIAKAAQVVVQYGCELKVFFFMANFIQKPQHIARDQPVVKVLIF